MVEGVGDIIKDIFVPDEQVINNLINSVTSKFAFVDTINNTVDSLKSMFTDTTQLPKMIITLPENKWKSGQVTLIDLSWYSPYKQYGDTVISAFIYVFFVWRIFIHLPNIINGVGGSVEMGLEYEDKLIKARSGKR